MNTQLDTPTVMVPGPPEIFPTPNLYVADDSTDEAFSFWVGVLVCIGTFVWLLYKSVTRRERIKLAMRVMWTGNFAADRLIDDDGDRAVVVVNPSNEVERVERPNLPGAVVVNHSNECERSNLHGPVGVNHTNESEHSNLPTEYR